MSASNSSSNNNIDDDNVEMAVKFLKHSLVKNSDKEKQMNFLKGKGLSDIEIEEAFVRCNSTTEEKKEQGGWVLDTIQKFSFAIGFIALFNFIYKTFILPYIRNEINKNEKVNDILESVDGLRKEVSQLTKELKSNSMTFQAKIDELCSHENKNQHQVRSNDFSSLKAEIETLKSLMLSSKEFPSAPFAPVEKRVPAWQLKKAEDETTLKEDTQTESTAADTQTTSEENIKAVTGNNNSDNKNSKE